MKRNLILITVLLIGLFAACSNNEEEPTPAPTQEVTTPEGGEGQQPPTTEGGALARIQNSGTLVAGTSADYPPFAFYNSNFALDGYEVALIREIGAEMGVDVQIRDIAFDGLADSLQLGQIDVAIAAISVTPEREAVADFSNVYYIGQAGVLVAEDSDIGSIGEAADMNGYRVGVQNQTVYQDWAQENLIDTGLVAQKDLHVYGQIEHAIADLQFDRIDMVLLDLKPAEVAEAAGGVTVAGTGLNNQRFAIALTQGETGLQTVLNEALIRLQNEGRLAELAKEYLDLDDVPPIEVLPPVDPGQPPAGCLDGSAYIQDLNLDDQNMSNPAQMLPGQTFRKGWRLQNIGTCTWDSNYALTYVGGNSAASQMGGQPIQVQGQVQPGQTYDFWVDLVAPTVPGTYQAFWAMQNGESESFGARVWVGITVVSPQPTPIPTVPPSSNVSFTVDRTSIQQGECVTFNWNVTNIQAVWFYPSGQDYTQYPTSGESSSTQCPAETTTYNLRILHTDGTVETRQITITVAPSNEAPRVVRFEASPSQVKIGQCLTLSWLVEGNATHVRITRGGFVLWDGAPLSGSMQDCPPDAGFAVYRIEAGGPGGTSSLQTNVSVFE